MFTKIRNRAEGDQGFTLIELLVVILIIGILAAIAIPSFLNQRTKGQDACAKSMLRTMQTGMETYYTDFNTYVGPALRRCTRSRTRFRPAPPVAARTQLTRRSSAPAWQPVALAPALREPTNFCVGMTSMSTIQFSLHRATGGVIVRECGDSIAVGTNGGGCPGGTW